MLNDKIEKKISFIEKKTKKTEANLLNLSKGLKHATKSNN
jgi:hypothetical protein